MEVQDLAESGDITSELTLLKSTNPKVYTSAEGLRYIIKPIIKHASDDKPKKKEIAKRNLSDDPSFQNPKRTIAAKQQQHFTITTSNKFSALDTTTTSTATGTITTSQPHQSTNASEAGPSMVNIQNNWNQVSKKIPPVTIITKLQQLDLNNLLRVNKQTLELQFTQQGIKIFPKSIECHNNFIDIFKVNEISTIRMVNEINPSARTLILSAIVYAAPAWAFILKTTMNFYYILFGYFTTLYQHQGYLVSELDEGDNASEMSPGSSTESYPAFARIGLRENPGKNLNQVTCPDRDSNPDHLVSRPDALTVTPQVWTTTMKKLQVFQNKILHIIHGSGWDTRTVQLHDDLELNTVSTTIRNMKTKLYHKTSQNNNPLINNLGTYTTATDKHRRPKSILTTIF
ncbi:hypothetical protein ANN_13148 [Periplaneta americana]|uniref:Uncharacterized protein n=1 Tax=Periplaneta americana TaxID=6978 RepID=A0ABQ8TKF5_PERAM|nr:hypothetical protein ANN_13148 [Periplaneta americana]